MKIKVSQLRLWEDYASLNLKTLHFEHNPNSNQSWVFLAKDPQSIDLKGFEGVFLVSTPHQVTPGRFPLVQSNFQSLAVFFSNLDSGKASIEAMQRCFQHMAGVSSAPRMMQFEEEVNLFSRQFLENSPGIGLEGFLNKDNTPFILINPKRKSLGALVQWLHLKHLEFEKHA